MGETSVWIYDICEGFDRTKLDEYLSKTLPDAKDFGCVFFDGGKSALLKFRDKKDVNKLMEETHENFHLSICDKAIWKTKAYIQPEFHDAVDQFSNEQMQHMRETGIYVQDKPRVVKGLLTQLKDFDITLSSLLFSDDCLQKEGRLNDEKGATGNVDVDGTSNESHTEMAEPAHRDDQYGKQGNDKRTPCKVLHAFEGEIAPWMYHLVQLTDENDLLSIEKSTDVTIILENDIHKVYGSSLEHLDETEKALFALRRQPAPPEMSLQRKMTEDDIYSPSKTNDEQVGKGTCSRNASDGNEVEEDIYSPSMDLSNDAGLQSDTKDIRDGLKDDGLQREGSEEDIYTTSITDTRDSDKIKLECDIHDDKTANNGTDRPSESDGESEIKGSFEDIYSPGTKDDHGPMTEAGTGTMPTGDHAEMTAAQASTGDELPSLTSFIVIEDEVNAIAAEEWKRQQQTGMLPVTTGDGETSDRTHDVEVRETKEDMEEIKTEGEDLRLSEDIVKIENENECISAKAETSLSYSDFPSFDVIDTNEVLAIDHTSSNLNNIENETRDVVMPTEHVDISVDDSVESPVTPITAESMVTCDGIDERLEKICDEQIGQSEDEEDISKKENDVLKTSNETKTSPLTGTSATGDDNACTHVDAKEEKDKNEDSKVDSGTEEFTTVHSVRDDHVDTTTEMGKVDIRPSTNEHAKDNSKEEMNEDINFDEEEKQLGNDVMETKPDMTVEERKSSDSEEGDLDREEEDHDDSNAIGGNLSTISKMELTTEDTEKHGKRYHDVDNDVDVDEPDIDNKTDEPTDIKHSKDGVSTDKEITAKKDGAEIDSGTKDISHVLLASHDHANAAGIKEEFGKNDVRPTTDRDAIGSADKEKSDGTDSKEEEKMLIGTSPEKTFEEEKLSDSEQDDSKDEKEIGHIDGKESTILKEELTTEDGEEKTKREDDDMSYYEEPEADNKTDEPAHIDYSKDEISTGTLTDGNEVNDEKEDAENDTTTKEIAPILPVKDDHVYAATVGETGGDVVKSSTDSGAIEIIVEEKTGGTDLEEDTTLLGANSLVENDPEIASGKEISPVIKPDDMTSEDEVKAGHIDEDFRKNDPDRSSGILDLLNDDGTGTTLTEDKLEPGFDEGTVSTKSIDDGSANDLSDKKLAAEEIPSDDGKDGDYSSHGIAADEDMLTGRGEEHKDGEGDLVEKLIDEEHKDGEGDLVDKFIDEEHKDGERDLVEKHIDEEHKDGERDLVEKPIDEEHKDGERDLVDKPIDEEHTDEERDLVDKPIDEEHKDGERDLVEKHIDEEHKDGERDLVDKAIDEEHKDGERDLVEKHIDEEHKDGERDLVDKAIDEEHKDGERDLVEKPIDEEHTDEERDLVDKPVDGGLDSEEHTGTTDKTEEIPEKYSTAEEPVDDMYLIKCLEELEYSRETPEGIKVSIYLADITEEDADVIVNAANSKLQHIGGVAKAIVDAGGNVIQKESTQLSQQYGALDVGTVCHTTAGKLQCRHIIHAVGPIWKESGDDSKRLLRFLLIKTFAYASQKLNAKSIALPAISGGIYGMPIETCAKIFRLAIKEFSAKREADTTVEDIRIVLFDPDVVGTFILEFCNTTEDDEPTENDEDFESDSALSGGASVGAGASDSDTGPKLLPSPRLPTLTMKVKAAFPSINRKDIATTAATVLLTRGNQPDGIMTHTIEKKLHLPGYEKNGTIIVQYEFSGGIQKRGHPNPGRHYSGTVRTAYLPSNGEGLEVLSLLRKAFDNGLLFTIGKSMTTGIDNCVVWNDVHHKTSMRGGPASYGYPDPTYLTRVKEELSAKGIY
ncbi:uncharacterized protein LOC144437202 isoform X2 [Glandiceps talaboti]